VYAVDHMTIRPFYLLELSLYKRKSVVYSMYNAAVQIKSERLNTRICYTLFE
jgi:hypothetical protein